MNKTSEGIVLTRKEMYDMLTDKPMHQVCEDFGISKNSLSHELKENKIPVRTNSDWQIIRSGRTVSREPLHGDPSQIMFVPFVYSKYGNNRINQIKFNNYPSLSYARLLGGSNTDAPYDAFRSRRHKNSKERYTKDGQLLQPGEYERSNGGFEFCWREKNGKHRAISAKTLEELRTLVGNFAEIKEEVTKRRSKKHYAACTDAFDKFSGIDFEYYCRDLLLNCGFTSVETTSRHNDDGVDLIANLCDIKFVIQCKRYADVVTKRAIQEVFAGKTIYHADVAVIITNSAFTRDAISTAEALNVKLWNGAHLKDVAMRAEIYSVCAKS